MKTERMSRGRRRYEHFCDHCLVVAVSSRYSVEDTVRKMMHPTVLLAALTFPLLASAQAIPDFFPDERQVRAALAFKVFDAPSARITELSAYPAPDGSTSDLFICGKVDAKDEAGRYAGAQNLAIGVNTSGAEPAYAALGVGEVASFFCELVAHP